MPLFSRLADEEWDELAEVLEPARFEAGQTIFEEGGPEQCLYVITAGTVEVTKSVLPGRERTLATMNAPTVVGEMGLLTEPRAVATVVARTPVEAYGIDHDRFLEMLDADSPAANKVVYEIGRTLAGRMAETDESISEIIAYLQRSTPHDRRDFDLFRDRLIEEWSF
ncbi:MAG: cyclic nucleotide-binding domain-containing protein [Actinomycetota bacterium]